MVLKSLPRMAPSPSNNSGFPSDALIETRAGCGIAAGKMLKGVWIRARLRELFSAPNPPYALNGSAALHLIFLGKRTPSDIDLRCENIEATREALSPRFKAMQRKSNVPVYGFLDANGVMIDLSQDRFSRPKKTFMITPENSDALFLPFPVLSYDFESLFAEKLIALTRKRDLKDLFDAYSCLSRDADFARVAMNLKRIGAHDGIDPLSLVSSSYVLDGGTGGYSLVSKTTSEEMLAKVQSFVRSII